MLANTTITALVGTMQKEASTAFYRDTLGLKFITDDGFAAGIARLVRMAMNGKLVVTHQHVETRLQPLDHVGFEQQRFLFC